MKLFSCQGCGQLLYFENIRCENCGRALGYLTDLNEISALEPAGNAAEGWRALAAPHTLSKFCKNYDAGMCNWLAAADDPAGFCLACRHNRVIPDLSVAGNDVLWRKIETAKHRLFYSLLRLNLPLENRTDDPEHGLAFDFLADPSRTHEVGVMTGHSKGLITLALKEADDVTREKVRTAMGEPYRTLLGHFRHEIGHYFWDRLVAGDALMLERFRALFGDDRQDYGKAVRRHYEQGPPANWQEDFISLYAASHPWEDFAETWAHYLHIVDTLETAAAFGLKVRPRRAKGVLAAAIDFDPYTADMERLIDAWLPVEFATNNLNRSMGLADLYPFLLSPRVIEKLGFVHVLTHGRAAQLRATG
ncbi:MAG TPA: putative zinc-binding peptidase [Rhizomicrobium sp.]|nr:putative zinc-binding peptidase [Rhizomicrobium sp.]